MRAEGVRWHPVCAEADIDMEDSLRVEVEGLVIAVFHTPSGFHALEGLCTHEQASLADGPVEGEYVSCPKHNSRFHIPTGRALRIPARVDLRTYPVKVEGGRILVGLPG
jgi:3-phenylpropionate/trans-cinnamate dioxygenase ferredoxin component